MQAAEQRDFVDELARFAATTRLADVPEASIAQLRTIFADTLAVIAAGMREPEMRRFATAQVPEVAAGRASVVGTGLRCNPLDAAALNAAAGVWLELDEGNLESHGHPGIHSLPTAFAIAQHAGRSGADLMLAAAIGYEVGARVSGAARLRIAVQPHGTWGVVGAAVAAARLRGMDERAMRRVIDIAGSTPLGGNRRTMQTGATVRNWYAGHSHVMGQTAVRLAEAGFTGPPDSLATTFGQVLSDGFDAQAAVAELGHRWRLGTGYIKLYPGARHLHSAIDALRDLLERVPDGRIAPETIERVDVRTHRLGAFCGTKTVTSAFGARFSIPFALATILVHGDWTLARFGQAAVDHPAVRALCQRIDVTEDPEATTRYPERQLCDIAIVLKDGRSLPGRCEIMRGEPANPNDPEAFRAKFRELAVPAWGEALADAVYEDAMRMETLADASLFAGGAAL